MHRRLGHLRKRAEEGRKQRLHQHELVEKGLIELPDYVPPFSKIRSAPESDHDEFVGVLNWMLEEQLPEIIKECERFGCLADPVSHPSNSAKPLQSKRKDASTAENSDTPNPRANSKPEKGAQEKVHGITDKPALRLLGDSKKRSITTKPLHRSQRLINGLLPKEENTKRSRALEDAEQTNVTATKRRKTAKQASKESFFI